MESNDDLFESVPDVEFAFPGPLRDLLVGAILAGEKTSTTTLFEEYGLEGEPLPCLGDRGRVLDSDGHPVALIEVVGVDLVRLGDVNLEHAIAEGEGYTTVAEWRRGHEAFWHSDDYRAYRDDPHFTVNDDSLAVLERFEIVSSAPESQPE